MSCPAGSRSKRCPSPPPPRLHPAHYRPTAPTRAGSTQVGLTLGTAVAAVPLDSERYLTRPQLIDAGNLLLDIIFSTLHNGAIEKARLGFQRL